MWMVTRPPCRLSPQLHRNAWWGAAWLSLRVTCENACVCVRDAGAAAIIASSPHRSGRPGCRSCLSGVGQLRRGQRRVRHCAKCALFFSFQRRHTQPLSLLRVIFLPNTWPRACKLKVRDALRSCEAYGIGPTYMEKNPATTATTRAWERALVSPCCPSCHPPS